MLEAIDGEEKEEEMREEVVEEVVEQPRVLERLMERYEKSGVGEQRRKKKADKVR